MPNYICIMDRNADETMGQTYCLGCGKPGEWYTFVELAAMAIRGYGETYCFDCDQYQAGKVPKEMMIDGRLPTYYTTGPRDESASPVVVRKTQPYAFMMESGSLRLSSNTYLNTENDNER